jgi:hypothetical protein
LSAFYTKAEFTEYFDETGMGRPGITSVKRPKTNANGANTERLEPHLHLFGDIIAFQTAGAYLQRQSSPFNLGFNLHQIGLPSPAGMVFGVAYLIAGNRMFSANITGP